jgi:hypothetical protein
VALDEGVQLLLCVNPLVPFDASRASRGDHLSVDKLHRGGLPLVLGQTFRAIIHSRMKVGMGKYRNQYPGSDVMLFEPDREDADMFFANIFSYRQRKRLCSTAFAKTRQNIAARARELAPILRKHGITIRHERLAETDRNIRMAMTDPRPLRADAANQSVRQTTRELRHTLDQLERAVASAR